MKVQHPILIKVLVAVAAIFILTYPIRGRLWHSAQRLRIQREQLEERQDSSRQVDQLRDELSGLFEKLADKPDDPGVLLKVSSICGQLRMYPDAMFYARQASNESPKYAEPHRAMGDIHFTEGRYDLAIEQYEKALDLKPDDFESGARLAYLFVKLGWSADTRRVLKALQKIGVEKSRLALLEAMFAYQNADFNKAIEMLNRALKSGPEQPEIFALFADINKAQSNQDDALANIEKALRLSPNEARYHIIRAQVLLTIPRPDTIQPALDEFNKALELSPRSVECLYGIGQCYKRLRNEDESLRCFRQVQQIAPEHPGVLAEMSQVLARKGQREEAQKMMDRYRIALRNESHLKGMHIRVAMTPKDSVAHFTLGRLHLKVGDHQRAIVEFKRALELRGNDAQVRRVLADALALAGRYDEARTFAPPRPMPDVMHDISSFRAT